MSLQYGTQCQWIVLYVQEISEVAKLPVTIVALTNCRENTPAAQLPPLLGMPASQPQQVRTPEAARVISRHYWSNL